MGVTAWRQVRAELAAAGIPSVLYVREERGLLHLSLSQAPPDLLLTNAHALTDECAALGYHAETVPSIVMLDDSRVESTRTRIVYINPVPIQGVDIALELAEARPDIPFLFQEWWPLPDDAREHIERRLRALPHAELRRPVTDPSVLYADARAFCSPRSGSTADPGSCSKPSRTGSRCSAPIGRRWPNRSARAVCSWASTTASTRGAPDSPSSSTIPRGTARTRRPPSGTASRPEVDSDLIVGRFEQLVGEAVTGHRNRVAGATASRPSSGD